MRALLASILVLACTAPAHAEQQADPDQLRAGVWERILVQLESLPARWDELPAPVVPPSGRSCKEVLDGATIRERWAASGLISYLVISPLEARARIITQARQQRSLSEMDVWLPYHRIERERFTDLDAAGLTLEAWLEMAAQLGRRDVAKDVEAYPGEMQARMSEALILLARGVRCGSGPRACRAWRRAGGAHGARDGSRFLFLGCAKAKP